MRMYVQPPSSRSNMILEKNHTVFLAYPMVYLLQNGCMCIYIYIHIFSHIQDPYVARRKPSATQSAQVSIEGLRHRVRISASLEGCSGGREEQCNSCAHVHSRKGRWSKGLVELGLSLVPNGLHRQLPSTPVYEASCGAQGGGLLDSLSHSSVSCERPC